MSSATAVRFDPMDLHQEVPLTGSATWDSERICDLALTAERSGNSDRAAAAYVRAIELDGANFRAHLLYSYFLASQEQLEEAGREGLIALRLHPVDAVREHIVDVLSRHAFQIASIDDPARIDIDALTGVAEQLIGIDAHEQAESLLRFPLDLGFVRRAAFVLLRLLIKLEREADGAALLQQLRELEPDAAWLAACEGLASEGKAPAACKRWFRQALAGGVDHKDVVERLLALADQSPNTDDRVAAYDELLPYLEHIPAHAGAIATNYHTLGQHAMAAKLSGYAVRHGLTVSSVLHSPMGQGDGSLDWRDESFHAQLRAGTVDDPLVRLLEEPERIDTLAAINFWGRSGSFLLSSLFDGHPQVLQVFPAHGLMEIVNQVLGSLGSIHSVTTLTNEIVSHFASNKSCGDWATVPKDRAGRFATALHYGLTSLAARGYLNAAMAFRVIHIAQAIACGRRIEGVPVIVYPSHDGLKTARQRLESLLPGMRFIACVRYPERTYDSHVAHHTHESPIGEPGRVPAIVFKYLIDSGEEMPALADRSVAVRFEDMHQATEVVMRALARWLGIKWNPVLLRSTQNNATWGMDSGASGGRQEGTRNLTRKDFKCRMSSWFDRQKMRIVLAENYRDWGYGSAPNLLARRIGRTLFDVPWKMHVLAFAGRWRKKDFRAAWKELRQVHAAMRDAMLAERARRDRDGARIFRLAYPLEDIPARVRGPR